MAAKISVPAMTQRNQAIAQRVLEGKTYRQIAKEFGIHNSTVCHILKKEECREIVDTGTRLMVAMVPKAVDNYRAFLHDEDKTVRYKATKDVADFVWKDRAPTVQPIINQYIQQAQISTLNPDIAALLGNKSSVIDADFQEISQDDTDSSE